MCTCVYVCVVLLRGLFLEAALYMHDEKGTTSPCVVAVLQVEGTDLITAREAQLPLGGPC